MTEFFRLAAPVILTVMLSGMSGVGIYLWEKVQMISDKQHNSVKYVIQIQRLENENSDKETRLRMLEHSITDHIAKGCKHEDR